MYSNGEGRSNKILKPSLDLFNAFLFVPVAVCPSAAAVVASAVSESTTPDVVVAAAVVEVELLCDGRLGRDVKDSWVR